MSCVPVRHDICINIIGHGVSGFFFITFFFWNKKHILFCNYLSAFCSKNGSYSEEGSEAEARRGRWCPAALAAAVHHWHVHEQASDQLFSAPRALPQALSSDSQHAERNWVWAEARRRWHPPVHWSGQEWDSWDVHGTVDAGSTARHEHLHLPSVFIIPCPHVSGQLIWGGRGPSGAKLLCCRSVASKAASSTRLISSWSDATKAADRMPGSGPVSDTIINVLWHHVKCFYCSAITITILWGIIARLWGGVSAVTNVLWCAIARCSIISRVLPYLFAWIAKGERNWRFQQQLCCPGALQHWQ